MKRRYFGNAVLATLLVFVACDAAPTAPQLGLNGGSPAFSDAADAMESQVYELGVRAGDPVFINLPGNPGGGGFTGTLYNPRSGRAVGSFVTDILPSEGTDIFAVLGTLMTTGTASVGDVRGTFATTNGTIVDRHAATLDVIGFEPATPGYEVLVAAHGVGVVVDGSGKYHRDGGTSDLSLIMEVDADGLLPALVVDGIFAFTLD